MVDLFVNYRAADAKFGAAAVYALLSDRFGAERIFLDHQSMPPGSVYPQELREALESSSALVVLIGPEWLAADPLGEGQLLIEREHDWVRREIRRALERNIAVVPVLLDGATLPEAAVLPEDIRELVYRQAARAGHQTLREDVARLADHLTELVPALALPDLFEPEPRLPPDPLPSELLQPRYRIVEFRDVDGGLPRLRAWLLETAPLDIRLITGPGGQGKTRLAAELIDHARAQGWVAGFVGGDAAPKVIARAGKVRAPMLLVVDYAEGRADQLRELVTALLRRPDGSARVRLLLLARSAGRWQRDLQRSRDARISAMFTGMTTEQVATVPPGDADRLAEFERAVAEFQRRLGAGPGPVVPSADLDGDSYARMLDLHAAALAAVLDRLVAGPMPERDDPLRRVLDHEERYWFASVDDSDLPDPHYARLRAVVSAATLFGARHPAAARALLAGLATFDGIGLDVVERYRLWLTRMYPGPAALNPLRPDRLGEDLVVTTLRDWPGFVSDLAGSLDNDQLVRALTVLARAAPRHPDEREYLTALLAPDLPGRIPVGMAVATQVDGSMLVDVLMELSAGDDPQLAELIVDELPTSSLALAAFAVLHTRTLLRLELESDPVDEEFVAALLHNLSIRLTDVGSHDQALVAAGDAVARHRILARRHPGHKVDLANALNTLAIAYSKLGLYGDGAAAAAESVEILDAVLTDPDTARQAPLTTVRTYLSTSLGTHGNLLGDLGLAHEATVQIERATSLKRELADEADSGSARADRRSQLASALENLATVRHNSGQHLAGLRCSQEAVAIFRELDADAPDQYRAELVRALGNLASSHANLNQPADGARLGDEAVSLARALVGTFGDTHLGSLANALNTNGVLTRRLGRLDRSLQLLDEAVSLYRRLAARRPGSELEGLAAALENLAGSLEETERPVEAIHAYEESVEIYRKLADPRPDVFEPSLAAVLTSLADLRSQLDDNEEALELAVEAVALLEGAAATERATLRNKLAGALQSRAYAAFDLGRFHPAAQDSRRSADLFRQLAETGDLEARMAATAMLHLQAQALDALEDHEAAAPAFAEAIALLRELAGHPTQIGNMTRDDRRAELASVLQNAAVCASSLHRHADAELMITEAVRLRRELLDGSPESASALAETLINLADTLCDVARTDAAAGHAGEAVTIALPLVDAGHPRTVEVAAYALATRARAIGGGNLDEAVSSLCRAWELAQTVADDDLVAAVRETLHTLDAPRAAVRRTWKSISTHQWP